METIYTQGIVGTILPASAEHPNIVYNDSMTGYRGVIWFKFDDGNCECRGINSIIADRCGDLGVHLYGKISWVYQQDKVSEIELDRAIKYFLEQFAGSRVHIQYIDFAVESEKPNIPDSYHPTQSPAVYKLIYD